MARTHAPLWSTSTVLPGRCEPLARLAKEEDAGRGRVPDTLTLTTILIFILSLPLYLSLLPLSSCLDLSRSRLYSALAGWHTYMGGTKLVAIKAYHVAFPNMESARFTSERQLMLGCVRVVIQKCCCKYRTKKRTYIPQPIVVWPIWSCDGRINSTLFV